MLEAKGRWLTKEHARTLGFRGAVVVHPKFLEAVNACYAASQALVGEAREAVTVFERTISRSGCRQVDGRMIDQPVYRRALELLREAGA